jgi:hypothetical protein
MKIDWFLPTRSARTSFGSVFMRVSISVVTLLFFVSARADAQSEAFPKWTENNFSTPKAITADKLGNLVVLGTSQDECVVFKNDPNGNILWEDWLSGPSLCLPIDVSQDAQGDVFMLSTLLTEPTNPTQIPATESALAKYSPAGVRQWVIFVSSSANVTREIEAFTVSSEGDCYVEMAVTQGPLPTFGQMFVVKYDSTGKEVWAKAANVTATLDTANSGFAVRLDAQNNVYALVTHDPVNAPELADSAIFEFDLNGNLLHTFGSTILGFNPRAFRVDPQGNSYYLGDRARLASGPESRIAAKFAPNGTTAWLDDLGQEPVLPFESGLLGNLKDIAFDTEGDTYIAQDLPSTTKGSAAQDISVIKFDMGGNQKWITHFNSNADESAINSATALAVNSIGDVYVLGYTFESANAPITIKYNGTGKQAWVKTISPQSPTGNAPIALAIGGEGILFVESDLVTAAYVQDAAQFNVAVLTFGNQALNMTSAAKEVTLTNTAEVPLIITDIAVDGDFTLINNCPSTLAPEDSCSLCIHLSPTTTGALVGVLSIRDDWAGSVINPRSVQLTGTGIQ